MRKVLSIDGGGIRGIIPALVLAEIESAMGKNVSACFDLIGGTSTGGILALGLAFPDERRKPKYTALQLADIYSKRGRDIFARSFWKGVSSVGGISDEVYSNKGIDGVLLEYFGEEIFSNCINKVFVTSYDIEDREPVFLKSWKQDHQPIPIRCVARATSAAPTYFEPALVSIGGENKALIDGGVFINTPAVSAYAEARKLWPNDDVFVLSLGTGELIREIPYKDAKDWGKIGWLNPLLSCMFDGVSDAANYQMQMLLGDSYIRLQAKLECADDNLDNASNGNIENLKKEASLMMKVHKREFNRIYEFLRMS